MNAQRTAVRSLRNGEQAMQSRAAWVLAVLCGAGLFTASAGNAAAAEETPFASGVATKTVWQVDMSGRPPYSRTRVEVPVVDAAAMEVSEYAGETTTVWVREHRGRPPFDRRRVEVPVVDAAALEIDSEADEGTTFRGRPPFRRH